MKVRFTVRGTTADEIRKNALQEASAFFGTASVTVDIPLVNAEYLDESTVFDKSISLVSFYADVTAWIHQ